LLGGLSYCALKCSKSVILKSINAMTNFYMAKFVQNLISYKKCQVNFQEELELDWENQGSFVFFTLQISKRKDFIRNFFHQVFIFIKLKFYKCEINCGVELSV
jgi:hypothetical protein